MNAKGNLKKERAGKERKDMAGKYSTVYVLESQRLKCFGPTRPGAVQVYKVPIERPWLIFKR